MTQSSTRIVGGLFATYLLVGGWNTAFGMLAYCGCVWLCEGLGRFGYLAAGVLSTIIAVTHSFLTYKLLVFRTKGNWLAEYLKCWSVYGVAGLLNFALLPVFVETVRAILPMGCERWSPYVGGLLLTGVTIVLSFIGHRHFTFKGKVVS